MTRSICSENLKEEVTSLLISISVSRAALSLFDLTCDSLLMDSYLVYILWYILPLYLLIHLLCFIFADADFTLLRASLMGHRPGELPAPQVSNLFSIKKEKGFWRKCSAFVFLIRSSRPNINCTVLFANIHGNSCVLCKQQQILPCHQNSQSQLLFCQPRTFCFKYIFVEPCSYSKEPTKRNKTCRTLTLVP